MTDIGKTKSLFLLLYTVPENRIHTILLFYCERNNRTHNCISTSKNPCTDFPVYRQVKTALRFSLLSQLSKKRTKYGKFVEIKFRDWCYFTKKPPPIVNIITVALLSTDSCETISG